jgi:hypothetical protein
MSHYTVSDMQKAYIAFFGRPGEPEGIDYWNSISDSVRIEQMYALFSDQNEYRAYYAAFIDGRTGAIIDAPGMLNAVYQNLFHREIEQEGKNFWTPLLISGAVTIDNVVTEVLRGAQSADYLAIQSKVDASIAFTASVRSIDYSGYAGAHDASVAHAWLAGIYDHPTEDSALQPYALTVAVNEILDNHAPTGIALSATIVQEETAGALIGTVSTMDPDSNDTHTYIVDDARFEVVHNTLKLKETVFLDFETETRVDITITATDHGGLLIHEPLTITVINLAEQTTPPIESGATSSVTMSAPELVDQLFTELARHADELNVDLFNVKDIQAGYSYTGGTGWVSLLMNDGSTHRYDAQGLQNVFELSNVADLDFSYAGGIAHAVITNEDGAKTECNLTGIIDGIELSFAKIGIDVHEVFQGMATSRNVPHTPGASSVTISAPELVDQLYTALIEQDGSLVFDLLNAKDIEAGYSYSRDEGWVSVINNDGSTHNYDVAGFAKVFELSNVADIEFGYADSTAHAAITNEDGAITEVNIVGIDAGVEALINNLM